MLIESDMIVAYMKKTDRLKESATRIFDALEEGRLSAQMSTEVFHEIYYVFVEHAPLNVVMGNLAKIASLENVTYVDATREIYMSALDLMNNYGITSIFDAIYAATALTEAVPDNKIVSTDNVYEKIAGLTRIDPREIKI